MKKGIQEDINRTRELMGMLNEWSLFGLGTDKDIKISYPLPFHANTGEGGFFGDSRDGGARTHDGMDLQCNTGTEVSAVADGNVITALDDDGGNCGGTVVINHRDRFVTIYCHLSKVMVSKGDSVNQKDIIGLSGGGANDPGRGSSSGPHLHFGLRINGRAIDPKEYLDSESNLDIKTEFDKFLETKVKGRKLEDWIRSGKIALAGGLSWLSLDEIKNKFKSGDKSKDEIYDDLLKSKIDDKTIKDHLKDKEEVPKEKIKATFKVEEVRRTFPCLSKPGSSQLYLNPNDEIPVSGNKVLSSGDILYYREFWAKFKNPNAPLVNVPIIFDKVDGKIVGEYKEDGKSVSCQ